MRALLSGFLGLAGVLVAFLGCSKSEPATAPKSEVASEPVGYEPAAELLPNGRQRGDYLLGGQPSPDQLERAAASGYKTIVSLRDPSEPGAETPEAVEALGMAYVSIPVRGAGGLTEENARKLDQALKAAGGPAVVHCAGGNRVGALFGLKAAIVNGLSPKEAVALAEDYGATELLPALKSRLER